MEVFCWQRRRRENASLSCLLSEHPRSAISLPTWPSDVPWCLLPSSDLHQWEHLIPQKESETVRSHLMAYSSEPAPKTTAWGAIMGHGLALPVLLWGHTTGPTCGCALLRYCITLLSLPWWWWAETTPLCWCWQEQQVPKGHSSRECTSVRKYILFLCACCAKW